MYQITDWRSHKYNENNSTPTYRIMSPNHLILLVYFSITGFIRG